MASRSSTWQKSVFSTGQFASEDRLYDLREIQDTAQRAEFREACLEYPLHEQPGFNQLVLSKGVTPQNLTLPPCCMESTWAGDYPADYEELWSDEGRKPYLIHWAGQALDQERPINSLFFKYLSSLEKAEWDGQVRLRLEERRRAGAWPTGVKVLNRIVGALYPKFCVQWRK